ncbi:MAG: hypothetical protein M0R33_17245 [Methylomonas sp.]|jgi:serine/threonine protein kinase|uniref:hypothetical protein n=1 Tax=Methylomonas sp. TaxID=418 RepID=UPI0025FE0FCD|nr:hypothetical protein [Methylomonas sp.]MCK9608193.1 hypothetical protein [Methylomonas sp.]
MPHSPKKQISAPTLDPDKLFDCEHLNKFANLIIKAYRVSSYSHPSLFECNYKGVPFFVKLAFYAIPSSELYTKSGPSPTKFQHTDAEIRILTTLKKEIIEAGISPGILEIITHRVCERPSKTFRIKKSECMQLKIKGTSSQADLFTFAMCQLIESINHGLNYDKCAFVVMERCDISLSELLNNIIDLPILGIELFKSILFQVISTYFALKYKYPKFCHYDLHLGNIMIKFDKDFRYTPLFQRFLVYDYKPCKVVFEVPFFGMITKIIDFGFGQIPELGILNTFSDDLQLSYHRTEFDMVALFHNISGQVLSDKTRGKNTYNIIGILNQLEPTQMYLHNARDVIEANADKIPTIHQMMLNPVFAEYHNVKNIAPGQIYKTYRLDK